MNELKIKKIDTDIVWEMIWKGWELSRVNYPLTLIIVALFFTGMMLGSLPLIGGLLSGIVAALAPLSFLQACHFWEQGKNSDLKEVLEVYKDKQKINAMIPLFAAHFALSAIPAILLQIPFLATVAGTLSFIAFPLSILTNLSYPIFFFNSGNMTLVKALKLVIEGISQNFIPFIIGGFLLLVLSFFSLLFMALPFFFVALPILITYNYLWYRVVYEGLRLEVKKQEL